MRFPASYILRDAQVARLEERRRALALSRSGLLQKFEEALSREGAVHTLAAAKMRLDRVLNARLRRPVTEATLVALASAMNWSFPDLEKALGLANQKPLGPVRLRGKGNETMPSAEEVASGYFQQSLSPREITFAILLLVHEIPLIKEEEMAPAELAGICKAIEKTWSRAAGFLRQWPMDDETNEPMLPVAHDVLSRMIEGTLEPLLRKYGCLQPSPKGRKSWAQGEACKHPELLSDLTLSITQLHAEARKLHRILFDD